MVKNDGVFNGLGRPIIESPFLYVFVDSSRRIKR